MVRGKELLQFQHVAGDVASAPAEWLHLRLDIDGPALCAVLFDQIVIERRIGPATDP